MRSRIGNSYTKVTRIRLEKTSWVILHIQSHIPGGKYSSSNYNVPIGHHFVVFISLTLYHIIFFLQNDHIESICKGNVTTRDGRQTTCDHLFCFKAYRSRAFGGQLSYCCDENLSKNCCCELSINRRIYCLSCTTMRQAWKLQFLNRRDNGIMIQITDRTLFAFARHTLQLKHWCLTVKNCASWICGSVHVW